MEELNQSGVRALSRLATEARRAPLVVERLHPVRDLHWVFVGGVEAAASAHRDALGASHAEKISHDGRGENLTTALEQILTAGTPGFTLAHPPR